MSPKCGTPAAYQAHRRRRETPCEPCRAASTAYVRKLRRRKNGWPEFSYDDLRQFVTGSEK